MSEKAVSIGFYVVASGVYTVLNPAFPILGAKEVTELVTRGLDEMVGASFAFEEDPVKGARLIIDHLDRKRKALKLAPMMYKPKNRDKGSVPISELK